jgi:hypothetical protein
MGCVITPNRPNARTARTLLPRPTEFRANLGILLFVLTSPAALAQPKAKNVLVLFSSIEGSPHFVELVEPWIRDRVPGPINFYVSYFGKRFG